MTKQSKVEQEEDAALVSVAERRARIIAYVNSHHGPTTSHEIADNTDMNVADFRWAVKALVEGGLVETRKEGTANVYFRPGGGLFPTKQAEEPQPRKIHKASHKVHSTNEVELVMNGVLIVVGRNPVSGRLRITIE